MTQAKKTIVSVDDTPFYHCMSRCVRRAFLCGTDHYSGNDYEHRREWLENKLHEASSILPFAFVPMPLCQTITMWC